MEYSGSLKTLKRNIQIFLSPTQGNCTVDDVLDVVKEKCEGKSNCTLEASDAMFGSSGCMDINRLRNKYLHIEYQCIKPGRT